MFLKVTGSCCGQVLDNTLQFVTCRKRAEYFWLAYQSPWFYENQNCLTMNADPRFSTSGAFLYSLYAVFCVLRVTLWNTYSEKHVWWLWKHFLWCILLIFNFWVFFEFTRKGAVWVQVSVGDSPSSVLYLTARAECSSNRLQGPLPHFPSHYGNGLWELPNSNNYGPAAQSFFWSRLSLLSPNV